MYKSKTIINKKSLGQHFFTDQKLKKLIIDKVMDNDFTNITEIGPGAGAFTYDIIERLKPTQAFNLIEKDDGFAQRFKTRLTSDKRISLTQGDVLDFDFTTIKSEGIIFGSLPYNISKEIILKVLTTSKAKKFYFIIQYEVAEKLKDHSNGPFYLLTALLAKSKMIYSIPRTAFTPQPNVKSAFIKIEQITDDRSEFVKRNYSDIERFIRVAFTNPRKTLYNNLRKSTVAQETGMVADKIELLQQSNNLLLLKRAEQLTLEEWLTLYKDVKKA